MISYGSLASHKVVQSKTILSDILCQPDVRVDQPEAEDASVALTILSAVSDPFKWNAVCGALANVVGADFCTLTGIMDGTSRTRYGSNSSKDTDFPTAPVVAYHLANRRNTFVPEQEQITCASKELRSGRRACGYVLDFGPEGIWLLRVGRRLGGAIMNEMDVAKLNAYIPHLTATSWITAHMQRSVLRQLRSMHEHLGIPFAALDGTGRILSYNANFEKTAAHYFANALKAPLPLGHADAAAFKTALRAVSDTESERELPLRDLAAPCVASLRLLSNGEERLSQSKLFVLTVRGLADMRSPNTAMLTNLYGLTHREADVSALLASGTSVNTIARKHDVSVSTIRVQLKSIFRKLSVRSQIELVAKLHASGV